MRGRICVFVIMLILVNIGCGKEENNPPTIVFGKIVGTYTGVTQVCTQEPPSQDMLCGDELSNTYRVVIYNTKSIEISDVLGVYNQKRVDYIKTADNFVHHFEVNDASDSLSLTYDEASQLIEVKSHNLTNDKIFYNTFKGKK